MSPPSWYQIDNAHEIPSPALLVWPDRIQHNIATMLKMVGGDPSRLCPHVKTYKMAQVIQMQVQYGITSFKCSTIAELELAAGVDGVKKLLYAYQPIGPNIQRLLKMTQTHPSIQFAALVDDLENLKRISSVFESFSPMPLLVDIDCGMGRTGMRPEKALPLIQAMLDLPGVTFAGLHVYDGHVHDEDVDARQKAYQAAWKTVEPLIRQQLHEQDIEIPLIVGGGSLSFPFHARASIQNATTTNYAAKHYQCSPGTSLLWDYRYAQCRDLEFHIAAAVLVRVLSKPAGTDGICICLDLGHKAIASENPIDCRVHFPDYPDAKFLQQSEEHLVIQVKDDLSVGDVLYGLPFHICPTVALHQEAIVVRNGHATLDERWKVVARDRRLTV